LKCVQMFCLSFWGGRLNFGPLDMEPFHLHSGGVGDVFLFRGSGDRCAVASPNTGRLRRACAEPRSAKGNRGVFVCALAADGLALLSVWELPRGPALVLLRCGRRLFVFCLGRACSLVSAVFGGGRAFRGGVALCHSSVHPFSLFSVFSNARRQGCLRIFGPSDIVNASRIHRTHIYTFRNTTVSSSNLPPLSPHPALFTNSYPAPTHN
jgi:hypothetical protein